MTSALDAGGMDEVVAFLARRLPEDGVDTTVLFATAHELGGLRPPGRLERALRSEGIRVVVVSEADGPRWLADNPPQVISAHGPPGWVLDTALSVGVPFVETLHGMHTLFGIQWQEEAARSRGITTLVAVSDLVRQQYLSGNPNFGGERIVTIPNGVDDQRLAPIDRVKAREWLGLRDEFLFVSLARHCVQKNSFGLVTAFADVTRARPDAHLLISGHAHDRAYAQQVLLHRNRLSDSGRIHLRDHSAHPAALLAAGDAFVLDSFFEGWPLASMEALFAGLPVVMSEVGGAHEQVGNMGERGCLVPNPLGNPLRADWETVRRARYQPQTNREALVAAIISVIDERDRWADARKRLTSESAERFRADVCLGSHATVLRRAATTGVPFSRDAVPS